MVDPAAQACEALESTAQWFTGGIFFGAWLIAVAILIGPRR